MKRLLLAVLLPLIGCVLAVSLRAQNLVPNGGFEAGRSGFEVMSWSDACSRPPQPEVSLDTESPYEGSAALRIDNTKANVFIEYHSAAVTLPPDGEVTYSVSLKADRPTAVRMYLLNYEQDAVTRKGTWFGSGKFPVEVGKNWSRHSFTWRVKKPHRRVVVQLEIQDPVCLWMDAVQLEAGAQATAYVPTAPVEGFIELDEHVFVRSDDPADVRTATGRIVLKNNEPKERTVTVRREGKSVPVVLQPAERKVLPFSQRLERYGVFPLSADIVDGATTYPMLGERYAVVGEMPKPRPGFFLGVNAANGFDRLTHILGTPTARLNRRPVWHSDGRATPAQHYRNVRLSGARLIRMHDNRVNWHDLQPEPDRWNWELLDTMVDGARAEGIETMLVLGNGGVLRRTDESDRLKDWFVRRNATVGPKTMGVFEELRPAMSDWTNYVASIARHCGTRLAWYEVMNEPNLVMTDAGKYVDYLKTAYRAVKEANPAATVVGVCTTGDFGAQALDYVSKIGELGGFGFFDVLSFHPYNAALDCSPLRAERQIADIRLLADGYRKDVSLLQDEIYYLTDITWKKPNFDLGRDWPAGNLVRRFAIDLAGGLVGSTPITFGQMQDTDVAHAGQAAASRFSWHFVPNERFVVSNMAGRHFEGATFVGRPGLDARLNGFVFRSSEGGEFATLWAVRPDESCTVELPEGVTVRDLFGNAVEETCLHLTDEPVYLFGSALLRKISGMSFCFEGEARFMGLTRQGQHYVARFANSGKEPIRLRMRLSNAHAIGEGVVMPGTEAEILLPVEAELEESVRLIVQDASRVVSCRLR